MVLHLVIFSAELQKDSLIFMLSRGDCWFPMTKFTMLC